MPDLNSNSDSEDSRIPVMISRTESESSQDSQPDLIDRSSSEYDDEPIIESACTSIVQHDKMDTLDLTNASVSDVRSNSDSKISGIPEVLSRVDSKSSRDSQPELISRSESEHDDKEENDTTPPRDVWYWGAKFFG